MSLKIPDARDVARILEPHLDADQTLAFHIAPGIVDLYEPLVRELFAQREEIVRLRERSFSALMASDDAAAALNEMDEDGLRRALDKIEELLRR